MRMMMEGEYYVVMMREEEARDLLSGDNDASEVFYGGLRARLGIPVVVAERPSVQSELVPAAIEQMNSMPASWEGRCEFGQAFTRVVELVYRNCAEGTFHYDTVGNRLPHDDDDEY